MYRPRECRAGELSNHIDDPSPARLAGGVAIGSEFIGPSGAFLFGGLAIPPKHQIGGAPDVDLGHHSRESYRHWPTKRLPLVEGSGAHQRVSKPWNECGMRRMSSNNSRCSPAGVPAEKFSSIESARPPNRTSIALAISP